MLSFQKALGFLFYCFLLLGLVALIWSFFTDSKELINNAQSEEAIANFKEARSQVCVVGLVIFAVLSVYFIQFLLEKNFTEQATTLFSGSLALVSILSIFQLVLRPYSENDWFAPAVVMSVTDRLFLALAYSLILYIFMNRKCFGRWRMVASSLALYFPTGLCFAATYKLSADSLSNVKTPFDYVYFSFITMSSTGYGDILPQTTFAKSLAIIEPFVGGYLILGLFIAAALGLSETISESPDKSSETSVGQTRIVDGS